MKKTNNNTKVDLIITVLDKLENKMDQVDGRLNSMDKTLVKQEENLKEHIRRTEILENELKPIKKHVSHIEGGLKLLGALATIAGLLSGLAKLFGII